MHAPAEKTFDTVGAEIGTARFPAAEQEAPAR